MKMSRRRLLLGALGGGAALAGAGLLGYAPAGGALADGGHDYRFLLEGDRAVLAAVVPVFLAGALPEAGRDGLVRQVLRDVDTGITHLSERTRAELRELFELLDGKLGRVVVAGIWSSWAEARPAELEAFLSSWRHSYLDLLRTAYAGLHDLVLGVWYGTPAAWPSIHYPGPPPIL